VTCRAARGCQRGLDSSSPLVSTLLVVSCLLPSGCRCAEDEAPSSLRATGTVASASVSIPTETDSPQLLYLPDGGDQAPPTAPGGGPLRRPAPAAGRCPSEMVSVNDQFCIDRYESVLVDHRTGRLLSPYYHPTRAQTKQAFRRFKHNQLTGKLIMERKVKVPAPPSWQLEQEFEPRAEVRAGVIPNGYLSADIAALACRNAGKRLCTESEWVTACRGSSGRQFPYGDTYINGVCNVFREAHPAGVLHGNASIHHLDPRLNGLEVAGRPLLRPTGATPRCRSEWGDDAVYDMVGNLAEWVDDPEGVFLGGFFSRSTRAGCERRVAAHPREYFDYSLGMRCCR
jgi:sulfatase modifying factor 1